MNIKDEVLWAEKRIRSYVRETPVEYSPLLSELTGASVFLKLENLQLTGSFKVRGAMNKLLSLSRKQREKGVITASTGNHGLGVAYALNVLDCKGTLYLPKTASETKIEALRQYDISLEFYGNDGDETEIFARKMAEKKRMVFISPYNDIKVIGGQGTIGVELMRQLKEIECVLTSVGGGGLISGIGGYVKSLNRRIEVIGCLPKHSPAMSESIKAGKVVKVEVRPTLSDGTAGNNEKDSITFTLCQEYVDDYILVSEDEIKKGIKLILDKHHWLIEGAAGVTVASLLKEKKRFKKKKVVLVLCGRNIGLDVLRSVICGG